MCSVFGDHMRQSPNEPLVVKKRLCPTHSTKLLGGALYDQVLAVHARLITSTFSPNPKSISIPLKETSSIPSFGNHGRSSGFSIPIRPWSSFCPFTPTLAGPLRTSRKS